MHTTHTHTLHSLQGELPCKVTSSSSTSQKQTVLTLKIRQTTSIHQQKVNKNMYIYKNIKHKIYIIYIQYIHSYSLQYIYIYMFVELAQTKGRITSYQKHYPFLGSLLVSSGLASPPFKCYQSAGVCLQFWKKDLQVAW